jgi:hypothetical protein
MDDAPSAVRMPLTLYLLGFSITQRRKKFPLSPCTEKELYGIQSLQKAWKADDFFLPDQEIK